MTHPRKHYTEATIGDLVTYGNVVFEVAGEPEVRPHGYGCRTAGCYRDGGGCQASTDPRSAHAVVSFVGTACAVPEDNPLRPFVRTAGDRWAFQVRGDLAWLARVDDHMWTPTA